MKVTCKQQNLSKGLGIVGRAVAARTTLPITQNVLIATDESRLKLSTTNLEIALTCWIGAKVEEEGAITVPARLLTQFVDSLPNENVDLALSPRGRTLELRCARFESKFNGQDAADFPPVPKVEAGISSQIDPQALSLAIGQVAFAAATEDTRPVLTGIHSHFKGPQLTLAAADGFRLAVHDLPLLSPSSGEQAVIIPARSLAELARLVGEQQEPVGVVVNAQKGQALFTLKNIEMVTQLIQGTFPNYTQLIPTSFQTQTVLNTSEFLRAARTVSILGRDAGGIIRLVVSPGGELGPGKVTLSARSEEIGENVGEIDAQVQGGEAKIAFNSRYLIDLLGAIQEEKVSLNTTTPTSPGLIRPVGAENYIHVIMPMFVQW